MAVAIDEFRKKLHGTKDRKAILTFTPRLHKPTTVRPAATRSETFGRDPTRSPPEDLASKSTIGTSTEFVAVGGNSACSSSSYRRASVTRSKRDTFIAKSAWNPVRAPASQPEMKARQIFLAADKTTSSTKRDLDFMRKLVTNKRCPKYRGSLPPAPPFLPPVCSRQRHPERYRASPPPALFPIELDHVRKDGGNQLSSSP